MRRLLENEAGDGMLIGYMRVSTGEQSLDLQRDALALVGCERVYDDVCSGRTPERPGLSKALEMARAGDTLVVWKLLYSGKTCSAGHFDVLLSPLSSRCSPGTKLLFAVGASAAASWGQRGGRSHHDHDVGDALGRPPVNFHSELATPSVPWGTSLRPRRNS